EPAPSQRVRDRGIRDPGKLGERSSAQASEAHLIAQNPGLERDARRGRPGGRARLGREAAGSIGRCHGAVARRRGLQLHPRDSEIDILLFRHSGPEKSIGVRLFSRPAWSGPYTYAYARQEWTPW